jgi:hypothetical protein
MKNLLIGYTTLVAFIVITMLSAMVLPAYQPNTQAAVSSKTQAPSCFKWVFDARNHNEVITNLWSPATGSLNATYATLSSTNNIKPQGDYYNPFKVLDIRVVDPYANDNTPDLRVGAGKMLIMNGGKHYRVSDVNNTNPVYTNVDNSFSRDNHDGGNLSINFNGSNVTQVKFDAVDMGDELGYYHGVQRINNNYYTVTTADGKTEKVGMNTHDGSNLPDKYVWKVSTRDYGQNIKNITVHFSGSSAIDNLEFCNLIKPTSTPPTIPTSTATPVPTATATPRPTATPTVTPSLAPVVCKERKTVTYFNNEMLAAGTFNKTNRTITDETRSKIPTGITLTNQTSYNVNLADSGKFVGDPSNVRFKYDINVIPMWGWRGDASAVKKQTNEAHRIQIKSGSRVLDRVNCLDWGNAKNYTDGVGALQSVESSNPISNSPYFQLCLKRAGSNPVTLPNNGKISIRPEQIVNKAVSVKATHITNQENFDNCVANNNGNKPICRGSHYSLVKVDYCVREGR